VTIVDELDRQQHALDNAPKSAWLSTVGAIARSAITDPEAVRQLLTEHGKTTDDLRRALEQHKQVADCLQRARTLPGLERHAEELSRRVLAKTAEAKEIPLTIAAKTAEAARLREEIRTLERQVMQSLADQVEARSMHRRVSNDATTARAALALLLEHDAIARCPRLFAKQRRAWRILRQR
jgi:phage I-like protein